MRILIAEDEPLMKARLCEMLQKVCSDSTIVSACDNGTEALEAFNRLKPDVVFLDVRMPGINGIELARRISAKAHIVFVTAYDEYAVEAFETGAADYLVKPVEEERLKLTVSRLIGKQGSHPPDISDFLSSLAQRIGVRPDYLKWIKATAGRQIKLVKVSDILFFQADTRYTRIVSKDSEVFIRKPLKEFIDQIDPEEFWQIHRSTVVRADAIKIAERLDGERLEIIVHGVNERLIVSRPYFFRFRETN